MQSAYRFHKFECLCIDRLGDYSQSGLLARIGEISQTFFRKTLEAVGRRAWFVRAAAQQLTACRLHRARRFQNLLAAFN